MNILRRFFVLFIIVLFMSCETIKKEPTTATYDDVKVVSAMKNVMWKGELQGKILLDTIANKNGLYGIGPESFLLGEILINDGICYVSRVASDTTMIVEERFDISAPFFVYGNVTKWNEIELPATIRSVKDIETFVEAQTTDFKKPFVFKLMGKVKRQPFTCKIYRKVPTFRRPKKRTKDK